MNLSRREFIGATLMAPLADHVRTRRPILCLFSKHLAELNIDQLGETVRQLGFDGVDLAVRAGGHVLPERAAQDLPPAVETLRAFNLTVPMITTALTSASDPTARPILSTAAHLKIPCYKLGYWQYGRSDIEKTIAEVKQGVAGLVQLGQEHAMVAGMHNHSGDYVGAVLWDIRRIIGEMDPHWIGYYFDPGHAVAEGSVAGWEINLRLALPRLKMVALKDFYWVKTKDHWEMKWCPMGDGLVPWGKVFSWLAAIGFAGPISLHLEYETTDKRAAIARDLEFVKKQLALAYSA